MTVGLVLLCEAVYFYGVLTSKRTVEAADAVVVFHGAAERNKLGYQLANDGIAPYLVISPATEKVREKYDKQYSRCGDWKHLVEDRADTTFQNALLTSRLIRDHGLKKIVLVTDAYHMPRSHGLLRLMLAGSGVTIIPCDTGSDLYGGNISAWSVTQMKKAYNEMNELKVLRSGIARTSGILSELEKKYRMTSQEFYDRFDRGEMGDDLPTEKVVASAAPTLRQVLHEVEGYLEKKGW